MSTRLFCRTSAKAAHQSDASLEADDKKTEKHRFDNYKFGLPIFAKRGFLLSLISQSNSRSAVSILSYKNILT